MLSMIMSPKRAPPAILKGMPGASKTDDRNTNFAIIVLQQLTLELLPEDQNVGGNNLQPAGLQVSG